MTLSHNARLVTSLTVALSALALSVAVALPPRDSRDVWSYVAYGRTVAVHHANPYTTAPNGFPEDRALPRVAPGWQHVKSVYGPVFIVESSIGALIAGDSPLANRMWHQGIAALSIFLFAVFVAYKRRSPASFFVLCLNPAVLFMVNGGHNDLLMGVVVALGFYLLEKNKYAGAILVAIAILIKATAIFPAASALAWRLRGRDTIRPALLAIALVVLAYFPFGGWMAVQPLLRNTGGTSRASIWSLPQHIFGGGTWLTLAWLACIAVAIVCCKQHDRVESAAAITVVAIFTAPYVLPWYCGWALPLAALATARLRAIAVIQSLLLLAAYAVPPGAKVHSPVLATISVLALPIGSAVIAIWLLQQRRKRHQPQPGLQQSSVNAN